MALVELASLRTRVGQPQSQTGLDDLLAELEAEAVQWIETQAGRPVAWVEDVVEHLDGRGDRGPIRLPYEVTKLDTLPHAIVAADIEVRLRDAIGDTFGSALATTAYEIRWDRLRNTHLLALTNGDVFPDGRDTVQITYSGAGWGGDGPPARADLKGLDLELVTKAFRARSIINGTSDRRDDPAWELSPMARGTLHRYMHAYGRRRSSSRVVSR